MVKAAHWHQGRVAIVTGGGTGIGAATCRRLAREGLAIVVAHRGSAAAAAAVVAEIEADGGSALVVRADIAVEAEVQALFRRVMECYGRVDVLVNNAGVGHAGRFADIPLEEFDRVFATNARGTFLMCREAARHISDGGRIINISTGMTRSAAPMQALYVASKLAVEGYTKVLARELGPRTIAVNTVSPGMTDTPLLEGGNAERLREAGARMAAMGRCGQPEDIADAIAALVSDDGRWISGQTLHVDGGSVIV